MTSIKELIAKINKNNFDILDDINIEYINQNDSKILLYNYYNECTHTSFGNINTILNYIKK